MTRKIALTGHTKGLGESLYKYFTDKGDSVKGFSRSTGYELPAATLTIVEEAKDCDIFIVNTNVDQAKLLHEMFNAWRNEQKTIVVMGSRITDYSPWVLPEDLKGYYADKLDLDRLCKNLRRISKSCRVILLRPGHFSTEKLENNLTMEEMCKVVDEVISSNIHFEDVLFQRGLW